MFARRLAVVGCIAAGTVVLAAQSAYATGGGVSTGTAGFVYDDVTVGGVTFVDSCEYAVTPEGTIVSGQVIAIGEVVSTRIRCIVVQAGTEPSPSIALPGTFAAVASTNGSRAPVTQLCIEVSAVSLDASFATAGPYCVS